MTKLEQVREILTRLKRVTSRSKGLLTIRGKHVAKACGCSPAFVSRMWKEMHGD